MSLCYTFFKIRTIILCGFNTRSNFAAINQIISSTLGKSIILFFGFEYFLSRKRKKREGQGNVNFLLAENCT